ncbi:response regulator [Enterocloster bolteae]|uniref:response regulator n=1 Tax=Enterocloster bolteae TaxID=208479 RepID=UPI001D090B9B|nr:response regulator [Enterocloster bolteae]MCB6926805.1 response regulator [Enterocloster bolteae]MCQ4755244.1 response regulator [Enterocloster bolteae]
MDKNSTSIKKKIAMAAVLVGAVLSILTFLFIHEVKEELWKQSVQTIIESTQQGCNTLKVQLMDDYQSMGTVTLNLREIASGQREELELLMDNYAQIENGISLYLQDGVCIPSGSVIDEKAEAVLLDTDRGNGIIDPHISSVTGVNVFDLFMGVTLKDGGRGYLVKEYEVDCIVDSFTLSFYNNAGFSYVVNQKGDVLIRSPHPNSNKTVQNLFDMLPETQNSRESLDQFARSLQSSYTGWATFNYQGEATVFCYTPLKLQSDWYLISIIPQSVVNAQTNEILMRSFTLIGCILLGIALLLVFYLRYANRTNRKLKNQAVYISRLYNAVPEGIALMSVEAPYDFLLMNQEGLRLFRCQEGASNEAMKGKSLRDVIHQEDYENLVQLFKDTADSGRKNIFEVRVITLDNGFFWAAGIVERTLDENGNPVLISAFHDITDEKLAEEAAEREKLQERLTLVGAISNAYPVIISLNLTRDSLNFIYVKPGLMLELGNQESYSQLYEYVAASIHPEHLEEFCRRFSAENLNKTLGQEKNEVFLDVRQMLGDGRYHWVSMQIIHVDNPYSGDKLAILISRRIDEQRYEEEQKRSALQSALDNARAASEAKSQFLSNMSHDIRTPMNAIVGMTAIASTRLDDRERVMECLKKISLSSKHLLSLINDVLDMSKIESGKLSIREEPFNLAELVTESAELVRPQAEAKHLEMDVHLKGLKNEEVVGDSLRIRQIYINILSNAAKYTPEGGSVHVEVRQEQGAGRGYGRYVFRCADTGIGMSSEFMSKLFQPFERAQDSTNSRVTGTGLGMAITKNLTDLMNGDIRVESRHREGSVFTVALPLQFQDAAPEAVPEEWVGIHCLIVDDDEQTCENASELLEDMGLRPQFVTKGAEAVRRVLDLKDSDDPFRLVIVDWKMPDMDGVEVARRIRQEVGREIPVIVLTAYDWSEIEAEAREAGVSAFLAKPFYRSKICYLLSGLSGEKEPVQWSGFTGKSDFTGKRVLLVEDNEMNREIAGTLIEEMGVEVEEACDGEEALERFKQVPEHYYNMILMDVQMPKMDGYESTRAIRALDREDAASVPIIAMTANAFAEDVQNALHAGMTAHFAKPIDASVLEQMLYKYLR